MRPEPLYEYISAVDEDTKNVDCSELPLEAEIHLAMVRNKIAIILQHMESVKKVFDLLPFLVHSYEQYTQALDSGDMAGSEAGDDPEGHSLQ